MPILAQLIFEQKNIELVNGDFIKLKASNALLKALLESDIELFKQHKKDLYDINDNRIYLSDIGKTLIFGGKGIGNCGESNELRAIKVLNETITSNSECSIISLKGLKLLNIAQAIKSQHGCKSDIELINNFNQSTCWLSLKDGNRANHFQQWSGMRDVFYHPEVEAFKDAVTSWLMNNNYDIRKTMLIRAIKDDKLKLIALYGSEFGQAYSMNNVNAILQGNIEVLKQDNILKLTSVNGDDFIHLNGELLNDDYEPVLCARYDSRSNNKNKDFYRTRLLIYPKAKVKGNNIIHV